MGRGTKGPRLYTRRQLLKRVPVGIAGALVVGFVSRTLLGRRAHPPTFPDGSIFKAAGDRRRKS